MHMQFAPHAQQHYVAASNGGVLMDPSAEKLSKSMVPSFGRYTVNTVRKFVEYNCLWEIRVGVSNLPLSQRFPVSLNS